MRPTEVPEGHGANRHAPEPIRRSRSGASGAPSRRDVTRARGVHAPLVARRCDPVAVARSAVSARASSPQRAPHGPAREQAAAQERALQRAVAVHAAAAEPGRPRRRPTGPAAPRRRGAARGPRGRCAGRRGSCGSAPRAARRAAGRAAGSSSAVRLGHADELVDDVAPGHRRRDDLRVLAEAGLDLPVPRDDRALQRVGVDPARCRTARSSWRPARRACPPRGTRRTSPRTPRPARPRRGLTRSSSSVMSLPVRSGFCSEPDSANSAPRIVLSSTNHEWSSPRVGDVLQRAEGVEAGEQRARAAGCRRRRATGCSGPARMRMPCRDQTGEWLVMPSG